MTFNPSPIFEFARQFKAARVTQTATKIIHEHSDLVHTLSKHPSPTIVATAQLLEDEDFLSPLANSFLEFKYRGIRHAGEPRTYGTPLITYTRAQTKPPLRMDGFIYPGTDAFRPQI